MEPISDKFPTSRGLSGPGSASCPKRLGYWPVRKGGPAAVAAAAAAAKCSRDCSSSSIGAAGKICYRTKGGEGQEREGRGRGLLL